MGAQHTGPVVGRPVFQPLTADDPTGVSGYRISARLGSRPGGRVYLAHAPGGIPVALRLLDAHTAARPGFAARFPLGVHALRQVHGPYVVPVVDSGTDGPGPWLATAYVPGLSLHTAVSTTGPLPVPSVLRLVAGIAEALRTIHHAGVTHGDLTPSHVLLAADGPRVKDFGLAAITGDGAVSAAGDRGAAKTAAAASAKGDTGAAGTAPAGPLPPVDTPPGPPVFLSPEQTAGKPSGPATDVFALGLIAAYAAIGSAPFGDGPGVAVAARVAQGEPDLNELPGELREIVTRCLIKDPALRPSPAQIIAMCAQAAPDASRRRADRWLPPALLAAIVPAMPPPAPPIPVAPPPTGHPGPLHYGWARPTAGHLPYRPHLPHLQRAPARRRSGTVVAAVAALAVVAAAGVVLVGRPDGADDHRAGSVPTAPAAAPSGPAVTTLPPDSGGGDATGAPAPSTGIPEPPIGNFYSGIQLPAGFGLSLVDDPPVIRAGSLTGDIGYTTQARAFTTDPAHGTLALLDPAAPGTLAGCRSGSPQLPSIPRESVGDGTRVCVRSTDGTVALVVFRALTPEGAPAPSASLDVTVWRTEGRSAEAAQGGLPNQ